MNIQALRKAVGGVARRELGMNLNPEGFSASKVFMKNDVTHKSGISIYRTLVPIRGYSSVVEHLTADQEVPGSNPGAP